MVSALAESGVRTAVSSRRLTASCRAGLPTFDDVPRLRYVEMVLAESMRLYPPAWAMGRYARKDFQLGEFSLPGEDDCIDEPVCYSSRCTVFSRSLCGSIRSALRRTPGRGATKFTYFPFGAGFRQCIGESFALMEGVLLLATLGAEVEVAAGPWASRRAGAADYAASEVWDEDAGRGP